MRGACELYVRVVFLIFRMRLNGQPFRIGKTKSCRILPHNLFGRGGTISVRLLTCRRYYRTKIFRLYEENSGNYDADPYTDNYRKPPFVHTQPVYQIVVYNNIMKRFVFLLLIVFGLLSLPLVSAEAAKVRVRTGAPRAAGGSYVTVRKSTPTHSLKLIFNNLSNVTKISYEVQYSSLGRSQGIVGSFTPTGGATDTRDVYLGTCSSGVCTAHPDPKSIIVTTRVSLKSGGTYTKVSRAATF